MRSIIWRLTLKLKRKSYLTQMSIFYFSSFLIVLAVLPFIFLTDITLDENSNGPTVSEWIIVSLFVPLFETFLFQQLPFKIMQNWSLTTNRYGIYILLSAIIFGLSHWYSLQYMIFAFAVGLVLGYMYFFYSKTPKVAFWSTVLIHGLRNLIACIAIWFDK